MQKLKRSTAYGPTQTSKRILVNSGSLARPTQQSKERFIGLWKKRFLKRSKRLPPALLPLWCSQPRKVDFCNQRLLRHLRAAAGHFGPETRLLLAKMSWPRVLERRQKMKAFGVLQAIKEFLDTKTSLQICPVFLIFRTLFCKDSKGPKSLIMKIDLNVCF